MFAVLHLPNFFLQAVLRLESCAEEPPVALVDTGLSEPLIIQASRGRSKPAWVAGLTPSQALARCGNLLVKPRSPAREKAATDILLQVLCLCRQHRGHRAGRLHCGLKGLSLPDEAPGRRGARKSSARSPPFISRRVSVLPPPRTWPCWWRRWPGPF